MGWVAAEGGGQGGWRSGPQLLSGSQGALRVTLFGAALVHFLTQGPQRWVPPNLVGPLHRLRRPPRAWLVIGLWLAECPGDLLMARLQSRAPPSLAWV